MSNESRIMAAEIAVAKILQELETETGMVLERIEVRDIDCTNLSSTREEWERLVRIEMKRLPGTRWGQADRGGEK